MFERRGNRFYPQASLSPRGTLGVLIHRAGKRVRKAGATKPYTKAELELTLAYVELLAFREDWTRIATVASRAIVQGAGPNARTRLYRAWAEALRADADVDGLQKLGRHLLAMRHESRERANEYVALACLAFTWAGRRTYGRACYVQVQKALRAGNETASALKWEAVAVWLSEAPALEERLKGVELYSRLCALRRGRYFTLRNYLHYALDSDELEHAATAYAAMNDQFPLAPEPYLASARVSMAEGKWAEAAKALQELLADNPRHAEGLLGLAQCFERTGDLVAARDLLTSNQALFENDDPDFNATLGTLNRKLYERYAMESYRRSAVRQLSVALKGASRLKLSEAPLHTALLSLDAGVGERVVGSSGRTGTTASNDDGTVWMLSADAALGEALVRDGDVVLRAPEAALPGQWIFLTRPHPRLEGVELVSAVFEITSPVVPDARYGRAVSARLVKPMSVPIEVELHDVRYPALDGWGCENFAGTREARFYSLPLGLAPDLLAHVERAA